MKPSRNKLSRILVLAALTAFGIVACARNNIPYSSYDPHRGAHAASDVSHSKVATECSDPSDITLAADETIELSWNVAAGGAVDFQVFSCPLDSAKYKGSDGKIDYLKEINSAPCALKYVMYCGHSSCDVYDPNKTAVGKASFTVNSDHSVSYQYSSTTKAQGTTHFVVCGAKL